VDRNGSTRSAGRNPEVALLAEGVDRNTMLSHHSSPSSRRAWIEI